MAAVAFSFDVNGTPVTIPDLSVLTLKRVAVYLIPDVLYTYMLQVPFELDSIQRVLQIRLFTNYPTVQVYEVANQAGMTDSNDIAVSNSLSVGTIWDYNRKYSSTDPFVFEITATDDGAHQADGTFSGDLCFYNTAPTFGGGTFITLPAPYDTLAITNGSFTRLDYDAIPII